jgi:hypothetical protein
MIDWDERDPGGAAHVPVSSLLSSEERAQVDRAIGHQVYMALQEERWLLRPHGSLRGEREEGPARSRDRSALEFEHALADRDLAKWDAVNSADEDFYERFDPSDQDPFGEVSAGQVQDE